MNRPTPSSLTPSVVISLLRKHAYLWIAPAVAGVLLTAFCSLATKRMWSASQGLIVRSEAAGYSDQRLGKFTDLSEMKTVQETMLELARSQSVVSAVLDNVGPPSAWGNANWPTREDIAKFRKRLTITPPGGAEFGNTEVFYIEVRDHSPQRAEQLVASLTNQLEERLQSLRNERANSMVHELERSIATAQAALAVEVRNLAQFEAQMGPQLGELRILMTPGGGQSSIEQQLSSIEHELRGLEANRQSNQELLSTLRLADTHPEALLATPSSLLKAQPTLLRLKEGLVNAQIRTASLLGSRSPEHPFVKASRETETNLRTAIQAHAPEAIQGVQIESAVYDSRKASLQNKLAELHKQQAGIAVQRTEYAQLLSNVENQTRVADSAQKQLADAQATRAGALGASVLARLDRAEAGLYPLGPGRTVTTAAGGLLGLLGGLGAVFFFHGPKPPTHDPYNAGSFEPNAAPIAHESAPLDNGITSESASATVATAPSVTFPNTTTHSVFVGS